MENDLKRLLLRFGFMRSDECREASGLPRLSLNSYTDKYTHTHTLSNQHNTWHWNIEYKEKTRESSCPCCNHQINMCVRMRVSASGSIRMRVKGIMCFHLSTCASWPCSSVNMPLALFYEWGSTGSEPSQHLYNKSPAHSCRYYITQQGFTDAEHKTACSGGRMGDGGAAGVDPSSKWLGGPVRHGWHYRCLTESENSHKTYCLGPPKDQYSCGLYPLSVQR